VAVYVADNTTINGPNYTTSRDVTVEGDLELLDRRHRPT
jgi:hypothetical protein